jgi:hypothetical protein
MVGLCPAFTTGRRALSGCAAAEQKKESVMPRNHFDLKKQKSLHDPVTFDTGERIYEVVDITDAVMDEVARIGKQSDLQVGQVLSQQLAVFTGQDPEEFSNLRIVDRAAILQFITGRFSDPLGRRSPDGDAEE